MVRINPITDAARLGHAVHTCAAGMIEADDYDVATARDDAGLEPEDDEAILTLMAYAIRAWGELSKFFDHPQVEAKAESDVFDVKGEQFKVTGTVDVCSPSGGEKAVFLDWKTGYIDDGYYQQMMGYAYILWCFMGRPESIEITGIVVFLRHRYYRVLKYDAPRLTQWEHDLRHNVLAKPDEYRPGKQCRYCDLFATCAARQAVVSGAIEDVANPHDKPGEPGWLERAKSLFAQLTEDNKDEPAVGELVSDMLFRMRLCQQAIENARTMLRQSISRVGPIPLGGGTHMVVRSIDTKTLDPRRALHVLRNRLSDTQITDCMRISLPKVLETFARQRQRGEKGKARALLEKELNEAGALVLRQMKRMEEAVLEETPDNGHSKEPARSEPADAGANGDAGTGNGEPQVGGGGGDSAADHGPGGPDAEQPGGD